jgi:hypothetical protein
MSNRIPTADGLLDRQTLVLTQNQCSESRNDAVKLISREAKELKED